MSETVTMTQQQTREVVINECYGGFSLSAAAVERLKELGVEGATSYAPGVGRDDHRLVAVVRELGKAAGGGYAELAIATIPADADWYIEEYDGVEWVAEGRTWDSDGERAR